MDLTYATQNGDGMNVVEHLMAGGEMVAAQLPSACHWSPERKLAAAVLASALTDVRDHGGSDMSRQRMGEALRWIYSDSRSWPFSFIPLCEQFNLNHGWVRRIVRSWQQPDRKKAPAARFRHAA